MNKLIIIIAFLIVPFSMNASTEKENKEVIVKDSLKSEIVYKKVERISTDAKIQNKTIIYNKSNDIISIKAYMKSLQIKSIETLVS